MNVSMIQSNKMHFTCAKMVSFPKYGHICENLCDGHIHHLATSLSIKSEVTTCTLKNSIVDNVWLFEI